MVGTGLGLRAPGTGSPWRWFFSAIWLVYLIQPVSDLFGHGHSVLCTAGGLAIVIVFCRGLRADPAPGRRRGWRWPGAGC